MIYPEDIKGTYQKSAFLKGMQGFHDPDVYIGDCLCKGNMMLKYWWAGWEFAECYPQVLCNKGFKNMVQDWHQLCLGAISL